MPLTPPTIPAIAFLPSMSRWAFSFTPADGYAFSRSDTRRRDFVSSRSTRSDSLLFASLFSSSGCSFLANARRSATGSQMAMAFSVTALGQVEVDQRGLGEPKLVLDVVVPAGLGLGGANLQEEPADCRIRDECPRQAGGGIRLPEAALEADLVGRPEPPHVHLGEVLRVPAARLAAAALEALLAPVYLGALDLLGLREGALCAALPRGAGVPDAPRHGEQPERPPEPHLGSTFPVNASSRFWSVSERLRKRTPIPKLRLSGTLTTSPSHRMGGSPGRVTATFT